LDASHLKGVPADDEISFTADKPMVSLANLITEDNKEQ